MYRALVYVCTLTSGVLYPGVGALVDQVARHLHVTVLRGQYKGSPETQEKQGPVRMNQVVFCIIISTRKRKDAIIQKMYYGCIECSIGAPSPCAATRLVVRRQDVCHGGWRGNAEI